MAVVWFFMVFLSVLVLIFNQPQMVISTMLDASKSGVELCTNLLGIYTVWLGIINILEKSGLADKLANFLSPIIGFLFRTNNPKAKKYIAINMSSNILGLGNASTPSGIKAMQALDDGSGKITFSGIMLIVINSVSVQLLPTTIIGLRESANSVNSTSIILPCIFSSLCTVIFSVCLVFLFNKVWGRAKK